MKKSLLLSLVILCSVTFQAFSMEPLPNIQEIFKNIKTDFGLDDAKRIMTKYEVDGKTLLNIMGNDSSQFTDQNLYEAYHILNTAAHDPKYKNKVFINSLNEYADIVLDAGCAHGNQNCLDTREELARAAYKASYPGKMSKFIGKHYKEMLVIFGLSTGAGVTAYYATPYINKKYGYNWNKKKVAAAAFVATAALSTGVCYYRS